VSREFNCDMLVRDSFDRLVCVLAEFKPSRQIIIANLVVVLHESFLSFHFLLKKATIESSLVGMLR
jgi:hypothetical protein